jgi:hypothetical protein
MTDMATCTCQFRCASNLRKLSIPFSSMAFTACALQYIHYNIRFTEQIQHTLNIAKVTAMGKGSTTCVG